MKINLIVRLNHTPAFRCNEIILEQQIEQYPREIGNIRNEMVYICIMIRLCLLCAKCCLSVACGRGNIVQKMCIPNEFRICQRTRVWRMDWNFCSHQSNISLEFGTTIRPLTHPHTRVPHFTFHSIPFIIIAIIVIINC